MKPRPKSPDEFYDMNEKHDEMPHEKLLLHDDMKTYHTYDLKRTLISPSYMQSSGVHFSLSVT